MEGAHTGNHMSSHHHATVTSNTNTTTTANGLTTIGGGAGHNSSPILPMTPLSSVSPPTNVICKKEINSNYHPGNVAGLCDAMKVAAMHESIKEEMNGMIAGAGGNPIAYHNTINGRLGHGGNSTPLGSNSSIITTPSPPITPSQNPLSYVPNHDYFWQYNQYPGSYNAPASYYSQVDYQSQANYSMGHSGYSTANMSLAASGNSFNGSMASQPFGSNGLDYMTPATDKYGVNMV